MTTVIRATKSSTAVIAADSRARVERDGKTTLTNVCKIGIVNEIAFALLGRAVLANEYNMFALTRQILSGNKEKAELVSDLSDRLQRETTRTPQEVVVALAAWVQDGQVRLGGAVSSAATNVQMVLNLRVNDVDLQVAGHYNGIEEWARTVPPKLPSSVRTVADLLEVLLNIQEQASPNYTGGEAQIIEGSPNGPRWIRQPDGCK